MTNRLLRNVSIPTMALLHLYISGSLYLIGYWSTFGLDVSNAVDFLEIPKSFIYPFIVSLGLFFFIVLINFISYSIFPKPKKPIKNNNEDVNTNHKKGSKIDYFIFFTPPVLIIAFFIFGETELFWILSGGYISFLLFIKVIFSKEVHNAVPNFTYFIPVIFLLIFTPIMSFSLGKANGLGVFQNRDIKYISWIIR